MTTLYRIAVVYSDGSSTYTTYKTEAEAMEKSVSLAMNLPKGARLELTVIIFTQPVVVYTAK